LILFKTSASLSKFFLSLATLKISIRAERANFEKLAQPGKRIETVGKHELETMLSVQPPQSRMKKLEG